MFRSAFATLGNFIRQHGHHVIFGMSIVLLALLTAWWAIFINRSIAQHRLLHFLDIKSTLKSYALEIGTDQTKAPRVGILARDKRFEITPCTNRTQSFCLRLGPLYPSFCLKIRLPVLKAIEREFNRKKFMLIGEYGFLVLLILLCSILLYRYIRLSKRSTLEIEEFWGRVTHEIKTPITGVKAFLQSIKNQTLSPGQTTQFVDLALKQVEKQYLLAETILAGYGLRSNQLFLQHRLNDLNLVEFLAEYFQHHVIHLTNAVLDLRAAADGKPPAPVFARADTHILKVILDNLVDNALKYTPANLELVVKTYYENKKAIISLGDNGPGITAEYAGKIFTAYKYLAGELPGKTHGSGIGLYICRQLVQKMGGSLLLAEQTAGSGAEFLIILDRAPNSFKQPGETGNDLKFEL